MLNLKCRFAWGFVCLWVAFSFWLLVIAVKPTNAAQDCTTNGCYKNTCIVSGTTIYSIANAQLGAACTNIYPDNKGNNDTCTGQVAGDFYQANGTIACNPAGQSYGTAPGCTKTGDAPKQFYCCTSDCKAKSSG